MKVFGEEVPTHPDLLPRVEVRPARDVFFTNRDPTFRSPWAPCPGWWLPTSYGMYLWRRHPGATLTLWWFLTGNQS